MSTEGGGDAAMALGACSAAMVCSNSSVERRITASLTRRYLDSTELIVGEYDAEVARL